MSELFGKIFAIEGVLKWAPKIITENLYEIHDYEPQEENEFNFINFILKLVSCYRTYHENLSAALEIIDDLEASYETDTTSQKSGDLFPKIKDGLLHVIVATKISLLLKKGSKKEVAELLERIKSIDSMNNENKACVYAIRSAVFALFTNEDELKGSTYIDKALALDPDNTQWLYVKALFTRKVRLMKNRFDVPSLQEKELFEKVHEKEPDNVVFKLYLASVYREVSQHALKRQELCVNFLPKSDSLFTDLKDSAVLKNKKAIEYYKEAHAKYPDSTYVTFRYAYGALTINGLNQNSTQVMDMLKAALKKDPQNGYGNLVMASYSEKLNKDPKIIKHHLEICQKLNVFDGEMNMIRLLYKENPETFNVIESLMKLTEKYEEKFRHAMIYSQILSYSLILKNDILISIEYAKKFYELNVSSSCLKVHRSCFVNYPGPFNLLDVLIDEIKFKMWDKNGPKEIRDACEKFMHFMNFQNVCVVKGYPQNFRQQILQGKPIFYNPKCQGNPSEKNTNPTKKPVGKYSKNPPAEKYSNNPPNDTKTFPAKNNARNKPTPPMRGNAPGNYVNKAVNKVPNTQKNTAKKTQNVASQLPSLMDSLLINPREENAIVEAEQPKTTQPIIEQPRPVESEKLRSRSSSLSSDTQKQILKHLLKSLKKDKDEQDDSQSRRSRSRNTSKSSELDEFAAAILKKLGLDDNEKKDSRKKYSEGEKVDSKHRKDKKEYFSKKKYDSSDTDSEYERRNRHRREDRSREKSRRKHRDGYSDSDFERKYKSKHHRKDSSIDRSSKKYRTEYTDSDSDKKYKSRRYREDRSRDRRSKHERDHHRRHHSKRTESRHRRRDSPSLERRSVRDVSPVSAKHSKRDNSSRTKEKSNRRTPSLDRCSNRIGTSNKEKNYEKRDRSVESSRTRDRSTSLDRRSQRHGSKLKDSRRERRGSRSLERNSVHRDVSVSSDRYSKRGRSPKRDRTSLDRISNRPSSPEIKLGDEAKDIVKRDRSIKSTRTRERSTSLDRRSERRGTKPKESRRKRSGSRSSKRDASISSSRYSKRDHRAKDKTDRYSKRGRSPKSARTSLDRISNRPSSPEIKLGDEAKDIVKRDRSIESTRTRGRSTSLDRRGKKSKESRRKRSGSRSSKRDASISSSRYSKRDHRAKDKTDRYSKRDRGPKSARTSLDRISNRPSSPEIKLGYEAKDIVKRDRSIESTRTRERSTSLDRRSTKTKESRRKRRGSRSSERDGDRYSKRDHRLKDKAGRYSKRDRSVESIRTRDRSTSPDRRSRRHRSRSKDSRRKRSDSPSDLSLAIL